MCLREFFFKVHFNERVKSDGDFPSSLYHLLRLDRMEGDGGMLTEDATLIFCAVLIKTHRGSFLPPYNIPKITGNILSAQLSAESHHKFQGS